MKKLMMFLCFAMVPVFLFADDSMGIGDTLSTTMLTLNVLSFIISLMVLILFIVMVIDIAKLKKHLVMNTMNDFWLMILIGDKAKARMVLAQIMKKNENFEIMAITRNKDNYEEASKLLIEEYQDAIKACDMNVDIEALRPK